MKNLQSLIGQLLRIEYADNVSWNVPTEIRLLDAWRQQRRKLRIVGIKVEDDKFVCAFVSAVGTRGEKVFALSSLKGVRRAEGGKLQNALFQAHSKSVKFIAETPEALTKILATQNIRAGLLPTEMYSCLYVGYPYLDPKSGMNFLLVIPDNKKMSLMQKVLVWAGSGIFIFAALCLWNAAKGIA